MICEVCRDGLEGIWDPNKTRRVGACTGVWFENLLPGLRGEPAPALTDLKGTLETNLYDSASKGVNII